MKLRTTKPQADFLKMANPTKPHYRFLPTLTEVVELPATPAKPQPAIDMVEPIPIPIPLSAQLQQPAPALDADALIDRLMLRLDGPLQADLRNTLTTLVLEHFRQLEPLLQDEIERSVRLAVEEAMSAEMESPGAGSLPLN